MKCSNCGGQYKTKELKCPYCGTENLIGHLWMRERSGAELEYEKARKEMGKKGSIYVVNRVVNRVLLISTGMFVAMMALALVASLFVELFSATKKLVGKKEMRTTMQQYHDEGNYQKLYEYMDNHDLFGEEDYDYTQSALLYHSYATYLEDKFAFMELTKEDFKENIYIEYYLTSVLEKSVEIYQVDIGIYDKPVEKNKKQYEEYRIDIEAFWRGSLGLSEEQVQMLIKSEARNRGSVVDSLKDEIIEQEAWRP